MSTFTIPELKDIKNKHKSSRSDFEKTDRGNEYSKLQITLMVVCLLLPLSAICLLAFAIIAEIQDNKETKSQISHELPLIERERVANPNLDLPPQTIELGETINGKMAILAIPEISVGEELPTVEVLIETVTYEKP